MLIEISSQKIYCLMIISTSRSQTLDLLNWLRGLKASYIQRLLAQQAIWHLRSTNKSLIQVNRLTYLQLVWFSLPFWLVVDHSTVQPQIIFIISVSWGIQKASGELMPLLKMEKTFIMKNSKTCSKKWCPSILWCAQLLTISFLTPGWSVNNRRKKRYSMSFKYVKWWWKVHKK